MAGNILIGSLRTSVGGFGFSGAAYLFDTSGNLLHTYHEPTPAASDNFGASVASVGSNILIGSPGTTVGGFGGAGAAYLFDSNGNLLKTFHEPTPASDSFGYSVSGAAGNIIIGSPGSTVAGLSGAGAAYVFDSNGNLLKTFHDPAPAVNDKFGASASGVGGSILIGSPYTAVGGLSYAGAAYFYRQFGLRDSCAAATGTDCAVINTAGTFQAGPNTVPLNVVAVSLRSARNVTLGTQMALTVMCNKEVTDAALECSALYIDGNLWGPSRDAFKASPLIIVNAEPYFFYQWHWYDPYNQRIVQWSYYWLGTNVNPKWYWTVYLWWRTYTANNLGVWTPWWWWWWWHWTYYLYWNYWSAGVGFTTS